METIAVDARRRVGDPQELSSDLARARRLAHLLDAQFNIGGIQVGWDAIIGLVPVVGDLAMALAALYPLTLARKHRLGAGVQRRMVLNVLVDVLVGEIPLLGDVFDVAFKSNLRNLALLERAAQKRGGRSSRD